MSTVLELEFETMTLKIQGKEHTVNLPYGESVDKLNEDLQKEENKGKELRLMKEFFIEQGLPEDVAKKLQLPHYDKIMQAMMPKKP